MSYGLDVRVDWGSHRHSRRHARAVKPPQGLFPDSAAAALILGGQTRSAFQTLLCVEQRVR